MQIALAIKVVSKGLGKFSNCMWQVSDGFPPLADFGRDRRHIASICKWMRSVVRKANFSEANRV